MIGSMAIEACVSQYPSACSFGEWARKLGASNCKNPVEPTRSTKALFSCARQGARDKQTSAVNFIGGQRETRNEKPETYQYTNDSSSQTSSNGGPPVEILAACATTSLPPSDSRHLLR